jgi:antitoxin ParD1/3/4
MAISLSPELERFITEKVQTGRYRTPDDVVATALQLLHERDEAEGKQEELRRALDVGIEQADAGRVGPLNAQETLARVRQKRAGGLGEQG